MRARTSSPIVHLAVVASVTMAATTAGCRRSTPHPTAVSDASSSTTDTTTTTSLDADVKATPDARAARLADSRWNVIVISIDSLRADMPWAGYERPIAPRLTALHARSTSFSRAYSTSSFTSKSLPGLLTGRYPSELARTGSFFTRYLEPKEFLCTALGTANVPCVGGHAHAYFGAKQSGFEHGFSDWQIVPGITFDYQTDPYVTSQKLTPLAIEILGSVAKKTPPFFAWFHFMDPHDEYKTHTESPHFGKKARDFYDEEVFYTDLWIGKLLDFIDAEEWSKRTVIVVTADHGEAFGEHGLQRHAHEIYDVLVHVPLFIYIPGQPARKIDEPRSHIDLAPTFAELLGAKTAFSEALPGASLVPELEGAPPLPRDVIVDLPEDEYNERRRALVHGNLKLIAFGNDVRFSLFDLASDPDEKKDLYGSAAEQAREMRALYKEASKRIKDVAPRGGIPKH